MIHKSILSLLIFSFLSSKAQIFRPLNLHDNVGITYVKGKYFSTSGKNGYWTLEKVDSIGRTAEMNNFKKGKLLQRTRFLYNNHNDIILKISDKDINNPKRIDTLKYEYEYSNNKIAWQKEESNNGDSTIYRMIENNGDSVTYRLSIYNYLPNKKLNLLEQNLILTYNNNLLTKQEYIRQNANKGITRFEYYENGKLKRRIVDRLPRTDGIIGMYVGGPGSDDQSYSYSYDKKGRVKDHYTVVNNKIYKLATYRYK